MHKKQSFIPPPPSWGEERDSAQPPIPIRGIGEKKRTTLLGVTARGFTLVEVLVVTVIFSIILTAGFIVLLAGQSAWSTTDTQIRLQESLRQILQRVSKELQESGTDFLVRRHPIPIRHFPAETMLGNHAGTHRKFHQLLLHHLHI